MKHNQQTYSDIVNSIEVSLTRIKENRMALGHENCDAMAYTVGVLKSLLAESVMLLPAAESKHILKVLENVSK